MDNMQQQDSDQPGPSTIDQGQGNIGQTDIEITKRSAVRQKMAIALMAVGGALVAGLIWFSLYGQKTGQ